MSITNKLTKGIQVKKPETMSLEEYFELCKTEPMAYAGSAARMLDAIGEPVLVDTSKDSRLSRLFNNRIIKQYPAFANFYGMEEAVDKIVAYFKAASQGLEESKQILYLLGPVGGGKSSLAEKLKVLMCKHPIYRLAVEDDNGNLIPSPVHDHPFCLIDRENEELIAEISEAYNIPERAFARRIASPWVTKRLEEFEGDTSKFVVQKVYPSQRTQLAVSKTEPGDENNQDISSLVGKTDIRQLEFFSQDDPDSYSFSGGLCKANQGLMEFVEMFKAPIKVLHPLLTATQEGNFNPSEDGISPIPFEGTILAHSNESEWKTFSQNSKNEAFLDRVCIVKVPYCLRVDEEVNIYEKMLAESQLSKAPVAPMTLKLMAKFSILSRLVMPENSSIFSKLAVYNGEDIREKDPKAKPIAEYREYAGNDEGMKGLSTRFAFKQISKVFNVPLDEVAANPVHLFAVLDKQIMDDDCSDEQKEVYQNTLKALVNEYYEFIRKEIQAAFIGSFDEYGQASFDRYVTYADFWIQEQDYRDPETGQLLDRTKLENELSSFEKLAGVSNPKDFRNEVVNFVLRARANNNGENPNWKSYEKLRAVIEAKIFKNTDEMLPVITFSAKSSKDDDKKHASFVQSMMEKGYTEKQVRIIAEWFLQFKMAA